MLKEYKLGCAKRNLHIVLQQHVLFGSIASQKKRRRLHTVQVVETKFQYLARLKGSTFTANEILG